MSTKLQTKSTKLSANGIADIVATLHADPAKMTKLYHKLAKYRPYAKFTKRRGRRTTGQVLRDYVVTEFVNELAKQSGIDWEKMSMDFLRECLVRKEIAKLRRRFGTQLRLPF